MKSKEININLKTFFFSIIFFLFIYFYCFFACTINSISFFSVFIPILFTGFLYFINLKIFDNQKIKILYTIFLIISLFILAIDIKNNFLPLTHMDFLSFETHANYALHNSQNIFELFQNSLDLFVFFISLIYSFFGQHPEIIAFYVFPFTLLIFRYMYKVIFKITNNKKVSILSAFILNILPLNFLFGFSVLREIPNEFFILLSFYFMVCFMHSTTKSDKIKNSLLAIFFSLVCASIHSGFIGIVCIYIYVILQKIIFKNVKIINIPIVLFVILLLFIISNTFVWNKIAGRFEFLNSTSDLIEYIQMRYTYLVANTNYIKHPPQNIQELLLSIPYRFIMFIFSPFFWQVYDISTLFAFLFDSIPRLLICIGILAICLKKNKNITDSEIIKIALLMLISTYLIFCLDVNNYGTAMRHRTKMLPIELFVFICYGYIYYYSIIKKKICSLIDNKKIQINNIEEKKMKKVLHLLASNKYSGAENVVCTIIENLKDEYDMAYCSPHGLIEKTLNEKNVKYYGMNKFNLSNLRKIIKDYNPDIIHAHDYRASTLAAFSGFKGKIISHLHNNCPFAKSWNLKTILYNVCISKFDKIIGVSDKIYQEAVFKNKIKNKYVTIYNYIDENLVVKKATEYKYKKNYDLFFIGRLTEQKNPFLFIDIVSKLKNNKSDIKAVIIGDGELKEECLKKISDYNLSSNIDMVGFVSNPFPIIKNSKVCIMPSKWEGFGLTAIESLILNKPVLNSGVGGLGEIFKDNYEFICNNMEDYIEKFNEINNKQNFDFQSITKKYCDVNEWKNQLKNCYKREM